MLLDTTVLVYAVGDDHPLRAPARTLVRSVAEGSLEATTTPEVIQEFAHVRSRRRSRADAVALAEDYANLLSPLAVVTAHHLAAGLGLWQQNPRLGAFDAVLAAVALDRGARLVSADSAFGAIERLTWTDLAGFGATE